MGQATLTAGNVIQAKTGTVQGDPSITLDAGTQAGSTVTIELTGVGNAMTDGGEGGKVPDGFEMDGCADLTAVRYLHLFRKREVAAGEGVVGSTSWDFVPGGTALWNWRVTEWDVSLESVMPLERYVSNGAVGTGITTHSTGTTATTDRANGVALAMHLWHRSSNTAQSFDWSAYTNGFTERDELRVTAGTVEEDVAWSWKFLSATEAVECTATVNLTTRAANDFYVAHLVVYAATTYG